MSDDPTTSDQTVEVETADKPRTVAVPLEEQQKFVQNQNKDAKVYRSAVTNPGQEPFTLVDSEVVGAKAVGSSSDPEHRQQGHDRAKSDKPDVENLARLLERDERKAETRGSAALAKFRREVDTVNMLAKSDPGYAKDVYQSLDDRTKQKVHLARADDGTESLVISDTLISRQDVVTEDGTSVHREYNSAGEMIAEDRMTPDGTKHEWRYDPRTRLESNVIQHKDGNGYYVSKELDAAGRVVRLDTDMEGRRELARYHYGADGKLESEDRAYPGSGREPIHVEYDKNGRPVKTTPSKLRWSDF